MKNAVKLLAVLPLAAILVGCGKPTIDLSPYVTINVDGYNSCGTAEIEGDSYGMCAEFESQLSKSNVSSDTIRGILTKNLDGSLDKQDHLSNGDVITFTWDADKVNTVSEQLNVNLKADPVSITVEGLEEPEDFDPFDYLKFSVSGVAPSGVAASDESSDLPVSGVYFSQDKYQNLSNGDQVIVTFGRDTYMEDCLEQGYRPTAHEKTVTVEGLDFYPEKIEDIPQAAIDEMDAYAQEHFKSYVSSNWVNKGENLRSVELVGNYLLNKKDKSNLFDIPNYLYFIYKIRCLNPETNSEMEYYYYSTFRSITVNADGSYDVNLSFMHYPDKSTIFKTGKFGWIGFQDLDSLYTKLIADKLDEFDVDSNL